MTEHADLPPAAAKAINEILDCMGESGLARDMRRLELAAIYWRGHADGMNRAVEIQDAVAREFAAGCG